MVAFNILSFNRGSSPLEDLISQNPDGPETSSIACRGFPTRVSDVWVQIADDFLRAAPLAGVALLIRCLAWLL